MLVEAQAFASGAVMKVTLRRSRSIICKKAPILRRELDAQCRSQRAEAECTQVLVEVAHPRRQRKHLNARRFGARTDYPRLEAIEAAALAHPAFAASRPAAQVDADPA